MVQRFRTSGLWSITGRPEINRPPPVGEDVSLLRLASYPNVWVKFTELYTASKTKVYPYKDVQPSVRRLRRVWPEAAPVRNRNGRDTRRIPLADELRLVARGYSLLHRCRQTLILGRNAAGIWKWKT